jgi:hypothetical protein
MNGLFEVFMLEERAKLPTKKKKKKIKFKRDINIILGDKIKYGYQNDVELIHLYPLHFS